MSEPMVSYDNVGFYLLSRKFRKHVKVVQFWAGCGRGLRRLPLYPPLMNSNDVVADYGKAFRDRSHAVLATQLVGFLDCRTTNVSGDLLTSISCATAPIRPVRSGRSASTATSCSSTIP